MPITEDVGTMGLNNFSGSNLGTNATFMQYENNSTKTLRPTDNLHVWSFSS